jgi:hypothetical protein
VRRKKERLHMKVVMAAVGLALEDLTALREKAGL